VARLASCQGVTGGIALSPVPLVLADAESVGRLAAELVADRLRAFPELRFLLPTGHTPHPMYAHLRRLAADGRLPSARAALLQLDELRGIGPGDRRSYCAYLRRELRSVRLAEWHTLDGRAEPTAECARHERALEAAPLGLAVIGLGRDGHVAFNEPGSGPESRMRLVSLRSETVRAIEGFGGGSAPTEALTVGISELRRCRELVLLVTGETKAEPLRKLLEGPRGDERPASFLLHHPRLTVICDRPSASALSAVPAGGEWAVVVLGHHRQGAARGLSAEGSARLRRAEEVARRKTPHLVLLSGYSSDGRRSEAEYLARSWRGPRVPLILEEAATSTSENAAFSLLLLLAMPEIRAVTVVTSRSHLRARYFFRPYRRYGLRLEFANADYALVPGLLNELRWVLTMQGQRRKELTVLPHQPAEQ
jgi:glucosamine-6-phosphate deaminase